MKDISAMARKGILGEAVPSLPLGFIPLAILPLVPSVRDIPFTGCGSCFPQRAKFPPRQIKSNRLREGVSTFPKMSEEKHGFRNPSPTRSHAVGRFSSPKSPGSFG